MRPRIGASGVASGPALVVLFPGAASALLWSILSPSLIRGLPNPFHHRCLRSRASSYPLLALHFLHWAPGLA